MRQSDRVIATFVWGVCVAGRGKELPCGSGIVKAGAAAAEIDKFQIEQRASEAPTNVCACDRRFCSEDNTVPNKRSIGRIRSSACLSRVCVLRTWRWT